jgi:hypothetical protein
LTTSPAVQPPSTPVRTNQRSSNQWPSSSGREALIEPTPLNTRATVFVTLALIGPSPIASSTG